MLKVMIVDDDAMSCELAAVYLESFGYVVRLFSNGSEAIAALSDFNPDAIITEIGLPQRSGYDLLRAARALPTSATIPVLFLTVRNSRSEMMQALGCGASDFILKPFVAEELGARLFISLNRPEYAHAA